MSDDLQPDALTDDAFLGGALHLLQPHKGARAGTDAVMLASSVVHEGDEAVQVLDAGCGVGAVALCLAWRLRGAHVTGVEIAPDLCALARRNAGRNRLADRVDIIEGDVTGPFSALEKQGVRREGYDHVLANPPYLPEGSARAPTSESKRRAHVMSPGELADWIRFLATCAVPRGKLWMIHRADALPELLGALRGRFGGVSLFPLFPHATASATRVLVTATKGSRGRLQLFPGLVLHGPDGRYTDTLERVLRHGAALSLEPRPSTAGER